MELLINNWDCPYFNNIIHKLINKSFSFYSKQCIGISVWIQLINCPMYFSKAWLKPDLKENLYIISLNVAHIKNGRELKLCIAHECRHIFQWHTKKVFIKDNHIYWNNKKHTDVKSILELKENSFKNKNHDIRLYNLPWEKDAINWQEILLTERIMFKKIEPFFKTIKQIRFTGDT